VLDDALVTEAFALTGVHTKKELLDLAGGFGHKMLRKTRVVPD